MKSFYRTERLHLHTLTKGDADFIKELVNTDGFIKFIGDRKVRSAEDAANYIQKILGDEQVSYWVVRTQNGKDSVGVITLIKRNYLDHPDIGFAFLPDHSKKGYALEAATVVLNDLFQNPTYQIVLAITDAGNVNSIKLLGKLGFRFDKEFEREKEKLFQYSLEGLVDG